MTRFTTSLDRVGWIVTVLITVITLAMIVMAVLEPTNESYLMTAGILTTVMLLSYALAPIAYEFTGSELLIHRPLGARRIPIEHIVQASGGRDGRIGLVVRVFGIGGLFGYVGKFWSSKRGFVTLHARNRAHLIVLTLSSGTRVAISPDNESAREQIVSAINEHHRV